jgi:hypothetical protein
LDLKDWISWPVKAAVPKQVASVTMQVPATPRCRLIMKVALVGLFQRVCLDEYDHQVEAKDCTFSSGVAADIRSGLNVATLGVHAGAVDVKAGDISGDASGCAFPGDVAADVGSGLNIATLAAHPSVVDATGSTLGLGVLGTQAAIVAATAMSISVGTLGVEATAMEGGGSSGNGGGLGLG